MTGTVIFPAWESYRNLVLHDAPSVVVAEAHCALFCGAYHTHAIMQNRVFAESEALQQALAVELENFIQFVLERMMHEHPLH